MPRQVDVAIIGAGTAGLTAIKEIKNLTKNYLLIDRGPLGTTCSRVGCMPSKVLLQVAHDLSRVKVLKALNIYQGDGTIDLSEGMRHVRKLRDYFVNFAVEEIKEMGDHFIQAEASFLSPGRLKLDNGEEVEAKAIIIATGSSPVIPKEWDEFKDRIVTTDSLFELQTLDKSWAVIGMGPLGLEMGQAMALLGCEVHGFDKNPMLGGLKDEIVHSEALKSLQKSFPIHLKADVKLSRIGSKIRVSWGDQHRDVDRILAAVGRKANVGSLNLKAARCPLDEKSLPVFDPETMKVKDAAIFLAGDMDGQKMVLHEAADDGRIAGFNALQEHPIRFKRKVKIGITFSSPNLCTVGQSLKDIKEPVVIGEVSFTKQGRSVIMDENEGMLRVYAEKTTGLILGAELAAPSGEHLAHLLAHAIGQKQKVQELLRFPFYHPTVEEGLRTALRTAKKQLDCKVDPGPDLDRCEA
ncbi:MAG: dihydrolipoyl dehydrogenase [Proteobacteria bacterium]|nr:MAG: dihydrolipoyl dehydrogenase [Pseudomonadota bacterium]